MKKNVMVYGLVVGVLLAINIFYTLHAFYNNENFSGNPVLGYAAFVIIFSLIYFGVKNYRNDKLDGYISFGKAFKTGFLIALVGSTMYVVVWLISYYFFVPDFLDVFIAHVLKDTPEVELVAKTAEMEQFKEMYKSPFFVIIMTYFEVLPIGLVVALISAAILKKKDKDLTLKEN